MFAIEIEFAGLWRTLATGFESRDAADSAVGEWKQANECYGDAFRVVHADTCYCVECLPHPRDERDDLQSEFPTPLETVVPVGWESK